MYQAAALHSGPSHLHCQLFGVQAAYFEQKFYATFFLAPEAATAFGPDASQRRHTHGRTRSADSRAPHQSPRDTSAKEHALPQPHAPFQASNAAQNQHSGHGETEQSVIIERQAQASDRQISQHPNHQSIRPSSPDLSPRGDLETDDPPTPRMYKSNVPKAAVRTTPRQHNQTELDQDAKLPSNAVVLRSGL